jgi:hypothetical protein
MLHFHWKEIKRIYLDINCMLEPANKYMHKNLALVVKLAYALFTWGPYGVFHGMALLCHI